MDYRPSAYTGTVNTAGGAYITGTVTAREFVGGDKIVFGRDPSSGELSQLLGAAYRRINALPDTDDLDRDELRDCVRRVEREAARGAEADPKKIAHWLRALAGFVPDVAKILIGALTNPAAGIAAAVQVAAERVAKTLDQPATGGGHGAA
jgi:hypothetical protein